MSYLCGRGVLNPRYALAGFVRNAGRIDEAGEVLGGPSCAVATRPSRGSALAWRPPVCAGATSSSGKKGSAPYHPSAPGAASGTSRKLGLPVRSVSTRRPGYAAKNRSGSCDSGTRPTRAGDALSADSTAGQRWRRALGSPTGRARSDAVMMNFFGIANISLVRSRQCLVTRGLKPFKRSRYASGGSALTWRCWIWRRRDSTCFQLGARLTGSRRASVIRSPPSSRDRS